MELLAADPSDEILIPYRALEDPRDVSQRRVPGGVAERIVQRLEVIEIAVDQRGHRGGLAGGVPLHGAVELAPIPETGERVAHGALFRLVHGAGRREPRAQLHRQALQLVGHSGVPGQRRSHHHQCADGEMAVEQGIGRARAVLASSVRQAAPEDVFAPL